MWWISRAAAALLLAALPAFAAEPPAGRWTVTAIAGQALENDRAMVEFASGRIAGTSGCNRFNGGFEMLGDGGVKAGAVASTRMACPPPFMEQELQLFAALRSVTGWRLADGGLLLVDINGNPAIRLRQAP